ncbi:MAG: hypothetical protein ACJAUN_001361 [Alcanivorax sp.]
MTHRLFGSKKILQRACQLFFVYIKQQLDGFAGRKRGFNKGETDNAVREIGAAHRIGAHIMGTASP